MSRPLRLAFMGTPDFSVPALRALADQGHEIVAVYSQPPRPVGRGHREHPSPVHEFAASMNFAVFTPTSLKVPEEQEKFAALNLDAAVVAAYGLILPKAILDAPRLGCVNIHASLLPRWRGAAPIHRALLAGDSETGITIMQMDVGLDTGAMISTERLAIGPKATTPELHDALANMGAQMIGPALAALDDGTAKPIPQLDEGVTYAKKLEKDEGRIDWRESAQMIERKIRALTPWPGVWAEVGGERLKILAADVATGIGEPGILLSNPLVVACGDGALALTRVQKAGKSALSAEEFLRGNPLPPGFRFDSITD